MARIKTTQRKAARPRGVPRHQLAPRHEGSSSGSNDPIGKLEARVQRLSTELRHSSRERTNANRRIAELTREVERLQMEVRKQDDAIDCATSSRSIAWNCEAAAQNRVDELRVALEDLQV
jgi:chromosome segregation ATPase